jgi:hypothetical protein
VLPQSQNNNLQTCRNVAHVAASGIGGAVGGFVTGGPAGAAIGGTIGLVAGGAEVALGAEEPGTRGAAVGAASGAMESAANGESFASGAVSGAVRGGFGPGYGIGAASGTTVAFAESSTRGFTSLTIGARGALNLASRGILAGWGAGIGFLSQTGAELAGEALCQAAFGQ